MADGDLSVDFDDLERGGARIKGAASSTAHSKSYMEANIFQYGRSLGGNGSVGASFEQYYQAADAARQFVDGLAELLDTHGSKTKDLGDLFSQVNDATITEAGGEGRRG
jgi:uncharacterized protein YukE